MAASVAWAAGAKVDLPAAAAHSVATDEQITELREQIFMTSTTEDAQKLWQHVATLALSREQRAALTQDFWAQKRRLSGRATQADEDVAASVLWPSTTPPADDPAGVDFAAVQEAAAAPAEEAEPDKVATWMQIMVVAGQRGWNAEQAAAEMQTAVGSDPISGDGWAMAQFLEHLKSGATA